MSPSDIEQIVRFLGEHGFPLKSVVVVEGNLQIIIEIPMGDTLQ